MSLSRGQRLPPRSPEHRRKLGLARAGRPNPHAVRAMARANRIVFDSEMVIEMLRLRKRGCNVEAIAAWIGVCRGVVMRELHSRGLPTGRWRAA